MHTPTNYRNILATIRNILATFGFIKKEFFKTIHENYKYLNVKKKILTF